MENRMSAGAKKVYTKGGDKGKTSLVGGKRVIKTDLRIEAYGTLDELNAVIGVARAFASQLVTLPERPHPEDVAHLDLDLERIQRELFLIGSRLACPDAENLKMIAQLPFDA